MFNLNKYSQTATDVSSILGDAATGLQEGYEAQSIPGTPIPDPISQDTLRDSVQTEGQKSLIDRVGGLEAFNYFMEGMKAMYGPSVEAMKTKLLTMPQGNNLLDRFTGPGKAGLEESVEEQGNFTGPAGMVSMSNEVVAAQEEIKRYIEQVQLAERNKAEMLAAASFNLKHHKKHSQVMPQPMPMPQPMEQQQQIEGQSDRFPVENVGDFIAKFAEDLLIFNNEPGTPEYERARIAAEEIRAAVSPGFEEEANSVLESIMQLDITQRNTASDYLIKLYEVMIPPALTGDQAGSQMEPVMGEKNKDAIKGIVRYSLTESVLNNNNDAMMKTAADQFGQQYLLYGPTEKRICPKLRGKNLSVGDVVSEYTCRMHCIDGIAIDDNKTICGEALWRANAMDKYSTEYVDENGKIIGGYINKRFEVNRNVPEENQQRLKPGETRKPKPAAWGSTESRLQDMRSKEGQARDYRPETNTGDPFDWCHDSDQNNVGVSQAERDRREEAMGNKLVQYTNRDQGENNPQKAFNMKQFKTAQYAGCSCGKEECSKCKGDPAGSKPCNCGSEECPKCRGEGSYYPKTSQRTAQTPVAYSPRDTHQTAVNPAAAGMTPPSDIQSIKGQGVDSGKPMVDPNSFENLLFAVDKIASEEDARKVNAYADQVIHIPRQWDIFHQHLAQRMDTLGLNKMQEPMPRRAGVNLQQHKEAENPQPHTVALPDHDYFRQHLPEDAHTPDVKPSKKKT